MKQMTTAIAVFLMTQMSQAWCPANVPSEVNNPYVYVNLMDTSHLHMDFVLVVKNNDNGRLNTYLLSADNVESLSSCSEAQAKGKFIGQTVVQENFGSLGGMSKAYRVCTFDYKGLVDTVTVCNGISGD